MVDQMSNHSFCGFHLIELTQDFCGFLSVKFTLFLHFWLSQSDRSHHNPQLDFSRQFDFMIICRSSFSLGFDSNIFRSKLTIKGFWTIKSRNFGDPNTSGHEPGKNAKLQLQRVCVKFIFRLLVCFPKDFAAYLKKTFRCQHFSYIDRSKSYLYSTIIFYSKRHTVMNISIFCLFARVYIPEEAPRQIQIYFFPIPA